MRGLNFEIRVVKTSMSKKLEFGISIAILVSFYVRSIVTWNGRRRIETKQGWDGLLMQHPTELITKLVVTLQALAAILIVNSPFTTAISSYKTSQHMSLKIPTADHPGGRPLRKRDRSSVRQYVFEEDRWWSFVPFCGAVHEAKSKGAH